MKKIRKTILVTICSVLVIIGLLIPAIHYLNDSKEVEYTVNGTSMEPTLSNEEKITVEKYNFIVPKLKRFDIVIFETTETKVIKRIIGLPGEKVEYLEGNLLINGKKVEEKFLTDEIVTNNFNSANIGEYTIPDNHYFVIGDNRTSSIDSRKYGSIPKSSIIGKVIE